MYQTRARNDLPCTIINNYYLSIIFRLYKSSSPPIQQIQSSEQSNAAQLRQFSNQLQQLSQLCNQLSQEVQRTSQLVTQQQSWKPQVGAQVGIHQPFRQPPAPSI
jgi:TolA-binding protein